MTAPTVSVVLPTRNRARVLRRAVGSVLAQSYRDLELIIVDDASTDGTEELVSTVRDPRLCYVQLPEHGGANAARNRGVAQARGSFIAFQDSDDEWLPTKLELQMAKFGGTPEPDLVYCKLLRAGSSQREFGEAFDRHALLQRNFIGTPTMVVRRELVEEHCFDEALQRRQDWELCLRLMPVCRFAFVDQVLVIAHQTADSISSDPRRLLSAYRHILARHEGAIRSNRRAMASFHYTIGVLEAEVDRWERSRADLLCAVATWPFAAKHLVRAAVALCGQTAYRRVFVQRGSP